MISLALTNFNRTGLLFNSFVDVVNNALIDEIVIVDDHSEEEVWTKLVSMLSSVPKIKLHRNNKNLGMSLNKRHAISLCKNEWVIIFDSDNEIKENYLLSLNRRLPFDSNTIYAPARALPNFDYSDFSSITISKDNVRDFVHKPYFGALINTCNYMVHRETYLANYVQNDEIKGTDTAWHFYNHIKNGGRFHVVPDLEYSHLVHNASTFMENVDYNMVKAKEIENLLMQL